MTRIGLIETRSQKPDLMHKKMAYTTGIPWSLLVIASVKNGWDIIFR